MGLIIQLATLAVALATLGTVIKYGVASSRKETKTMANISDLQTEVTALTTVESSAVALINGLAQQLKDAKNDPVAIQGVIDSLEAGKTQLASAVAANTPAAA